MVSCSGLTCFALKYLVQSPQTQQEIVPMSPWKYPVVSRFRNVAVSNSGLWVAAVSPALAWNTRYLFVLPQTQLENRVMKNIQRFHAHKRNTVSNSGIWLGGGLTCLGLKSSIFTNMAGKCNWNIKWRPAYKCQNKISKNAAWITWFYWHKQGWKLSCSLIEISSGFMFTSV